jgi:ATP-binding cassette subfamily F protein 3
VAPFLLPSPEKPLAPPLIRLEGASVGYGGPPILKRLDLRLDIDDRIGLLGVNGSGKSTFARMIAGDLKAEGQVRRDGRMKVGWFHQHQIEALDPTDTPLEIIRRVLPELGESQRRSRLAQFGMIASKVDTTVANLSGGERARLLLNLVAMQKPHLLILDEPTNHLDIDSRRALTEALNDYSGAVILITHDRSLMEMVADRLWLVNDGTIAPFDGDMNDYAKHVLDRARAANRAAKAPPPPPVVSPGAEAPLKRKLEAAEQTLARETKLAAELEQSLADPELYREPTRLAEIQTRQARVLERLATAEAEWMAAAERYEAARVGA